MTPVLTLMADLLVAVLLVATIASSLGLSRRITQLKSDESAMRRTIGDLVVASETAERAIAGLRTTLSECDRTLAERLRTAERYAADLAGQVEAGEAVMDRISRIVDSSRQVTGQRAAGLGAVELGAAGHGVGPRTLADASRAGPPLLPRAPTPQREDTLREETWREEPLREVPPPRAALPPREADPRGPTSQVNATVAAAQAFAERVARRSGEWAT